MGTWLLWGTVNSVLFVSLFLLKNCFVFVLLLFFCSLFIYPVVDFFFLCYTAFKMLIWGFCYTLHCLVELVLFPKVSGVWIMLFFFFIKLVSLFCLFQHTGRYLVCGIPFIRSANESAMCHHAPRSTKLPIRVLTSNRSCLDLCCDHLCDILARSSFVDRYHYCNLNSPLKFESTWITTGWACSQVTMSICSGGS